MTKAAYRAAAQARPLGSAGIETLRSIAKKGLNKVNETGCDSFTASAIVAVWDKLTPDNRTKLESLPLHKAASVCFRLINRLSSQ